MTKTTQGGTVHGKHHRLTGDIPIRAADSSAGADDEPPTEQLAAIDGEDDHTRPTPIDTTEPADTAGDGRDGTADPHLAAPVGGSAPTDTIAAHTPPTGAPPPTRAASAVHRIPPPTGRATAIRVAPPPITRPADATVSPSGPGGADQLGSRGPGVGNGPDEPVEPDEHAGDAAAGSDPAAEWDDPEPDETAFSRIRALLGSTRVRIAAGAAVAILALGLAGLVGSIVGGQEEDPPPAARAELAPISPSGFGEQVTVAAGWTITVDAPSESDARLPEGVARAVRFEITLTNGTDRVQDSGIWTVRATSGGRPVELLNDDDAETDVPSRTVRPGASLSFSVTVPVPKKESEVQLEFLTGDAEPVLFVGSA